MMELTDLIQQVAYILYNFIAFISGVLIGYIVAKREDL